MIRTVNYMYWKLPYPKQKILECIEEEALPFPDIMKSLIPIKRGGPAGESGVYALIDCSSFELRNGQALYLSLRAKGTFVQDGDSSIIELTWEKPWPTFLRRLFGSYEADETIITAFMKTKLQAKVLKMHPGLSTGK